MPLLPSLSTLAAAAVAGPAACAGLATPHGDVTVTRAEFVQPAPAWVPAGHGPYAPVPVKVPLCRVEGTIEGTIGFELWLPVQWNGRLLGAGVGGDAGVFNYRDMSIRVAQGFATVTTDAGHKAAAPRWMADPKANIDYQHRAVHLTTQAAKQLVARHFGRPAQRSYYLGCSGGGRQALKEMQNYPADYDGVVAGAPGPYMPLQSVRMLWFSLEQQRQPEAALRDADWSLYERRVHEACDPVDGRRDGVIENPARCRFDTRQLLCKPGQGEGCLTAPRLAMLDRIVAPMVDEQGRAMDGGLFAGVRTRPGPPSPLLRAMWADGVHNDPDWDAMTFRRSADLAAANQAMPELRADRTAIQPFVRRGGKAILYQGWQDPSTNAGPTIDYYARLARANGGLARLDDAVRLFMVPGMYHCRGGPGADLFGGSGDETATGDAAGDVLWALIRWVEQGQAPASLEARKIGADGAASPARTLCAFPASARPQPGAAATRFTCRTDPMLSRMMR